MTHTHTRKHTLTLANTRTHKQKNKTQLLYTHELKYLLKNAELIIAAGVLVGVSHKDGADAFALDDLSQHIVLVAAGNHHRLHSAPN